jgi:hypothetical protein
MISRGQMGHRRFGDHGEDDSEANGGDLIMSLLLIEPILDRYIAQTEKRDKDWKPKEVEALLLRLRKEILDCLR